MNYSQKTHDWNGNIFHDEQIGHFLQVCESPNIKDILGDVSYFFFKKKIFIYVKIADVEAKKKFMKFDLKI